MYKDERPLHYPGIESEIQEFIGSDGSWADTGSEDFIIRHSTGNTYAYSRASIQLVNRYALSTQTPQLDARN